MKLPCVHYHMRLVSRSDSAVIAVEAPGYTGCAAFEQSPEIVLLDREHGPCRVIPAGNTVTMAHDDKHLVYLQRES